MVKSESGKVTVRPIAGTRPRGATDEEDAALAAELLADPKERAEHIMLLDLGRNDVGRICRYGTVKIEEEMIIERFSHVMHMTSTVTGLLDDGKTCFDAFRNCFPAGTVSGAPKIRAMEILDELEPVKRGPYAGAVGYVDFRGNLDTCIAIRTLIFNGHGGHRPGRRRHRRGLRAGARVRGDAQQGARPFPRDPGRRVAGNLTDAFECGCGCGRARYIDAVWRLALLRLRGSTGWLT